MRFKSIIFDWRFVEKIKVKLIENFNWILEANCMRLSDKYFKCIITYNNSDSLYRNAMQLTTFNCSVKKAQYFCCSIAKWWRKKIFQLIFYLPLFPASNPAATIHSEIAKNRQNKAISANCPRSCPTISTPNEPVCGSDGLIYANVCEMKKKTCSRNGVVGVTVNIFAPIRFILFYPYTMHDTMKNFSFQEDPAGCERSEGQCVRVRMIFVFNFSFFLT